MSAEELFALRTTHGMPDETWTKGALKLVNVALDQLNILDPFKPVPQSFLLMCETPISFNLIAIMRLRSVFEGLFTNLAVWKHWLILFFIFLHGMLACLLVLCKISLEEGLSTALFAAELNTLDHLHHYGVDLNESTIICMTIRAFIVSLINPTLNARRTEKLILAGATLYWLAGFTDDLVAYAAENEVFNISYRLWIMNSVLR